MAKNEISLMTPQDGCKPGIVDDVLIRLISFLKISIKINK